MLYLITNKQLQHLNNLKREEYIRQIIPVLAEKYPDWAAKKTDKALYKFATQMIALCEKYRIGKKENIQRFIQSKIEHNFDLTKQKQLRSILTEFKQEETQRLDNFENSLLSKNYSRTLLHLNTENKE